MSYYSDPSVLNGPKNSFFTEETSEYHRNRIKDFPEHEKTMKQWTLKAAERHLQFEKAVKAKERHLLNFNN